MPHDNPTEVEKQKIHQFYTACSNLLESGTIPAICVQRAFEEAMSGFLAEHTWRPTHISKEALREAVRGNPKNLQRAHGVVGDRLDRYTRTVNILSKKCKTFEEWWPFYRDHDATVLITKEEHASDKRYTFEDLVELPHVDERMFERSGFSFKMRKKFEIAWLKSVFEEIKL